MKDFIYLCGIVVVIVFGIAVGHSIYNYEPSNHDRENPEIVWSYKGETQETEKKRNGDRTRQDPHRKLF